MTTERPPSSWSDTEKRLWRAYRRGERLDLRAGDARLDDPSRTADWPADRTVRADALALLLLHGPQPEPGRSCRLDLLGARVTGRLDLTGATVAVPVKLMACGFAERVVLDYAEVTWWNLDGSHLPGLDGEGLRVGLWLGLRNGTVADELWLHDARISGGLDLSGTTLRGSGGFALMGKQMTVDGGLRARGLRAAGELRLSRSRIGGTLDLTGARLSPATGADGAADLEDLRAQRLLLDLDPSSRGTVSLAAAEIGTLVATPGSWPGRCTLDLAGTTFTALEPVADCPPRTRLDWLTRHVAAPSPAVHARVAAAYRQAGQEQAARTVLIRQERLRHRSFGPAGRIWGLLLEAVVGFGYRPARALLWLALLVAAGTAYFGLTGPPRPVNPAGGPTWDPLLYVLDLVVPFLGLGQRTAWDPAHAAKAVALSLTVAGWVLATAVAGGAARVLNRST
ncbi:hypothetical protein ACGFX4_07160 [Kitasatospora sp. NPDC048365]|uniref:hypothetical protein n=1 Tax=Kitasatospora sp. NPDC048365 TaxID=3364050 RepID=UPI003715A4E8